MRISDWSSDVCSSDLVPAASAISSMDVAEYPFFRKLLAAISSTLVRLSNSGSLPDSGKAIAGLLSATDKNLAAGSSGLPCFNRSEEHTSELQSLMRISYAVFCLKKKKDRHQYTTNTRIHTH